jgi:DNA invertase Pin-like site-specific DNA recombinase
MDWRWPLAALAAALTLMTAPAAFGASSDPPAAAGWHGREIRDPLARRVDSAVARFPRGWSAGSVGAGVGYATPNGSRRVREVQRRLARRGYRPGAVDGRFGPRTRAAVMWFQTKHGLPRSGRVDARSIATLRQAPRTRTRDVSDPLSAAQKEAGAPARPLPAATTGGGYNPWLLVASAAIIMAGLAAITWWMRTELGRRSHTAASGASREARTQLTVVAPPPAHAPVDVVGYVAVARTAERDRALGDAAQLIGGWCEGRDWRLTRIVHDVEPASGRIIDRPGLAYVLDQIACGHVEGVVLARLGDLTRSATELAKFLHWLNRSDAFMIALDYELDTSTAAGELAAGALMEVGDWERGRIADRTRPGLTAIRSQGGATASRASVRDDPELSARIRAMRDRGMSLQAISDTLNAKGVPTLRGGTHWRPSSVQAATGYKRPPAKPSGDRELPPVRGANGRGTHGRWDSQA